MLTIAAIAVAAVTAEPVPNTWLDAVQVIETGGESNPDSASGDKGLAKGRFQFHKAAWNDCSVVRKAQGKKVYPYSKATDKAIATEYARTWLTFLRERITLEIGRPAMAHEVWLAYNMGFSGFKKYSFQIALVPDEFRYNKAIQIYNKVYAAKLTKR
jgi:hypothetical protein